LVLRACGRRRSAAACRTTSSPRSGSCRFLVKDRLDATGARWSLTGAEAVLLPRAVIDNGDFERYWRYFTELDHLHTHAVRYQGQLAPAA